MSEGKKPCEGPGPHTWEALSKCQLQFLPRGVEGGKCQERYSVSWGVRRGEVHDLPLWGGG